MHAIKFALAAACLAVTAGNAFAAAGGSEQTVAHTPPRYNVHYTHHRHHHHYHPVMVRHNPDEGNHTSR